MINVKTKKKEKKRAVIILIHLSLNHDYSKKKVNDVLTYAKN